MASCRFCGHNSAFHTSKSCVVSGCDCVGFKEKYKDLRSF